MAFTAIQTSLAGWPWATVSVASICLAISIFGTVEQFAWQRSHSGSLLRWLSASFVHYSDTHLIGNATALLITGSIVERATSSRLVLAVCVAAVVVPMVVLFLLLPSVIQFAGSSCLAYAMTAVIIVQWWRPQILAACALLAAVIAYQVLQVMLTEVDAVQPVWQMHISAMFVGAALALQYRYSYRPA